MNPFRRRSRATSNRAASTGAPSDGPPASGPFVCAICGRSDLPPAGDWDPPICVECDAEINFAAIEEVELTDD
jgi:hypothetical protein